MTSISPRFVGEGHGPPAKPCAAAFSRLAQNIKLIRRGGIYPARGALRRRNVPGTMQASSPTGVCGIAGSVFSRLAAMFPPCSVGRAILPAAPPQVQKTCADGHFLKISGAAGSRPSPTMQGKRSTAKKQSAFSTVQNCRPVMRAAAQTVSYRAAQCQKHAEDTVYRSHR